MPKGLYCATLLGLQMFLKTFYIYNEYVVEDEQDAELLNCFLLEWRKEFGSPEDEELLDWITEKLRDNF